MIRLLFFLAGMGGGWLLKGLVDKKTDQAAVPPVVQAPQQMSNMSLTDWDAVSEEQFAMAESPPEDIPDEIEVPALPFEEQEAEEADEEDEEDHPNGFHPVMDAPRIEIITEDQYLDAYFAYGKDSLLYFREIDELTFSDEDRVDDKNGLVGKDLDQLFGLYGQEGVLYVRNNRLSIDFMIEARDGKPYWYESE